MNFKLNECQYGNCFKTKVQLNKCEIHMNVTFTFHLPEGTTVMFGLVYLGNRTISALHRCSVSGRQQRPHSANAHHMPAVVVSLVIGPVRDQMNLVPTNQLAVKSIHGLVNLRTSQVTEMGDVKCTNK